VGSCTGWKIEKIKIGKKFASRIFLTTRVKTGINGFCGSRIVASRKKFNSQQDSKKRGAWERIIHGLFGNMYS